MIISEKYENKFGSRLFETDRLSTNTITKYAFYNANTGNQQKIKIASSLENSCNCFLIVINLNFPYSKTWDIWLSYSMGKYDSFEAYFWNAKKIA